MENKNDENFYYNMFSALTNEYSVIFIVAKDGKLRPLRMDAPFKNSELVKTCLQPYNYTECMKKYIECFVVASDKLRAFECVTFENILHHLEKEGIYRFNYLYRDEKEKISYHQVAYFRLLPEQDDAFLMCFKSVDELVKEEQQLVTELAHQSSKLQELNNELQKKQQELKYDISLIKSMNKIYFMSYYIDLEHDTFVTLQEFNKVSSILGVKGNATQALLKLSTMITPSNDCTLSEARAFANMKTINKRLQNKDVITLDYLALTEGFCQAALIAGERDEQGNLKTVFMACRHIHDEKKRELEYNNLMQKQLLKITTLNNKLSESNKRAMLAKGILEGLSKEYHTIWLVDKGNLNTYLVRTTGISTIQKAVRMNLREKNYDVSMQKYVKKYVVPSDRERVAKAIYSSEVLKQMAEHGIYTVNYLRCTDEGKVGYHQLVFANITGNKHANHFTFAFRDIDATIREEQQKQQKLENALQAAEQANQAKTNFLNNMSHDIRTPMNAILGFTGLMQKELEHPEVMADYLGKVKNSGEYLLSIINNTLDMARIESGQMTLDESLYSFSAEAANVLNVFEESLKKKNIQFNTSLEITHQQVITDVPKLQQIVVNLLSNAIKYTPEGGRVDYTIRELPCDRDGYATYQIIIADNGLGMSKEFQTKIFDAFTREKNTTESKIIGTGLGTAIVKKLVDFLGGNIELESELGNGSTFRVTLTYKLASSSAIEEQKEQEKNDKIVFNSLFSGKRILLAEDNELNAEIACAVLEDEGFKIDVAEDGEACVALLEQAEAGYYALILMDIQMPKMDGYEATKVIRTMDDKAKAGIPIIAMTANAFADDKQKVIQAGMNGHIAKPLDLQEMRQTIASVLV